MSDLASRGDFTSLTETPDISDLAVNAPADRDPNKPNVIIGRSPGQLAWIRLKRDRSAFASAVALVGLFVVAVAAPLIQKIYGQNPTDVHSNLLDRGSLPLGINGGMTSTHWLGVSPALGRDVLMQLVYGMRTSLLIAFAAAALTTVMGVLIGITAGYATGWLASMINWFTDFVLAFPFLVFALAAVPVITERAYGSVDVVPSSSFRVVVLILVLSFFGWPYTARIVRGQVLSLKEREFIEAARAAGAGTNHILFRQLLPNLWAPILVVFSLAVPGLITGEAALSFLNIGVIEPTPDLGRMIFDSLGYVQSDIFYTLFPGMTILLLVLAFNLFGDSLRDALDPKSSR